MKRLIIQYLKIYIIFKIIICFYGCYNMLNVSLVDKPLNHLDSLESKKNEILSQPFSLKKKFICKVDRSTWDSNSFTISPNYKSYAYISKESDGYRWMINGKKEKKYNLPYLNYYLYPWETKVLFSSDGEHYVYAANINNKWCIVFDGDEGEKFDKIDNICFSPDGNLLLYEGVIDNKVYIIINNNINELHNKMIEKIICSPNSEHIAYISIDKETFVEFLVLDGETSVGYYNIWNPIFSPDSKKFAFSYRNKGAFIAFSDSAGNFSRYKEFAGEINSPEFSSDSRYIVYTGRCLSQTEFTDYIVIIDTDNKEVIRLEHINKQIGRLYIENGIILYNSLKISRGYEEKKIPGTSFQVYDPNYVREVYEVQRIPYYRKHRTWVIEKIFNNISFAGLHPVLHENFSNTVGSREYDLLEKIIDNPNKIDILVSSGDSIYLLEFSTDE